MGFSLPSVESLTSSVTEVLDYNPTAMPFVMPPQVQMGYEIADVVGLDVPTPEELVQLATGEIDKVLQGVKSSDIYQQASDVVTKLLTGDPKDFKELLNSLEWLLW